MDNEVTSFVDRAEQVLESSATDDWLHWGAGVLRARATKRERTAKTITPSGGEDETMHVPATVEAENNFPGPGTDASPDEIAKWTRRRMEHLRKRNTVYLQRQMKGEITSAECKELVLTPLEGFDVPIARPNLVASPHQTPAPQPGHEATLARSPLDIPDDPVPAPPVAETPRASSPPAPPESPLTPYTTSSRPASPSPQPNPPKRSGDRKGEGNSNDSVSPKRTRKRVVEDSEDDEVGDALPKKKRPKAEPKVLPLDAVRVRPSPSHKKGKLLMYNRLKSLASGAPSSQYLSSVISCPEALGASSAPRIISCARGRCAKAPQRPRARVPVRSAGEVSGRAVQLFWIFATDPSPHSAGAVKKAASDKRAGIGERSKGEIGGTSDDSMPHFGDNVDGPSMDVFDEGADGRSSAPIEIRSRDYVGKLRSGTQSAASLRKLLEAAVEADNLNMEALLRADAICRWSSERVKTLRGLWEAARDRENDAGMGRGLGMSP